MRHAAHRYMPPRFALGQPRVGVLPQGMRDWQLRWPAVRECVCVCADGLPRLNVSDLSGQSMNVLVSTLESLADAFGCGLRCHAVLSVSYEL